MLTSFLTILLVALLEVDCTSGKTFDWFEHCTTIEVLVGEPRRDFSENNTAEFFMVEKVITWGI